MRDITKLPLLPLSADEDALIRALERVMIVLPQAMDAEMLGEQQLSLTEYMTWVFLSEAPRRAMRMSDLAAAGNLSFSGMTRVVARLEAQGLVDRVRCDADARGWKAVLADAGLDRLERAHPTNLASVRQHVLVHLKASTSRNSPASWSASQPSADPDVALPLVYGERRQWRRCRGWSKALRGERSTVGIDVIRPSIARRLLALRSPSAPGVGRHLERGWDNGSAGAGAGRAWWSRPLGEVHARPVGRRVVGDEGSGPGSEPAGDDCDAARRVGLGPPLRRGRSEDRLHAGAHRDREARRHGGGGAFRPAGLLRRPREDDTLGLAAPGVLKWLRALDLPGGVVPDGPAGVRDDRDRAGRGPRRDVGGFVGPFPPEFASHSEHQEFYFGDDHLLRRHDYRVDIASGFKVVHYVHDFVEADGFQAPTQRLAYRDDDDRPLLDTPMVSTI